MRSYHKAVVGIEAGLLRSVQVKLEEREDNKNILAFLSPQAKCSLVLHERSFFVVRHQMTPHFLAVR